MKLNPKTYQAYKLFHDGVLAFARAEAAGLRVDVDYITHKKEHIIYKIARIEKQFKATNFYKHWAHTTGGKVNINSGHQLGNFLYGTKKLTPPKLTPNGYGSTDEESLRQLNIPELDMLFERGRLKKAYDVLCGFEREQVNGYIHPFFNLHLVRTFRSSSDHPNFQNIPKRDATIMELCRRALYPRSGHQFVEIDYGQLEVRIAACYNQDQKLIHDILHGDMHSDMAAQIFCVDDFNKTLPEHYVLRQATKNGFVFPQFYGDYYKNCANYMASEWCKLPQGIWSAGQGLKYVTGNIADHLISKGIKSFDAFTAHIKRIEDDFWGNRFEEYAAWKERWWRIYNKYGYIDLLTGFRCSGVMTRNDVTNYPVQGAAFHCLLWSFIELDRLMRLEHWKTRLVGQVHDSILLDVHPSELDYIVYTAKRVTTELLPKAWKWINVPLDIDTTIQPVDHCWVN